MAVILLVLQCSLAQGNRLLTAMPQTGAVQVPDIINALQHFSVIWVSLCYNFFCGPDGLYWSQLFIIYTGGRHQGILLYLCRHALNLLANLEIKNLLGRPWLCSLHGPCRAPSTTTRHYIHYITDHQQRFTLRLLA